MSNTERFREFQTKMGALLAEYQDAIGPTTCAEHEDECTPGQCNSRVPDRQEEAWVLAAWTAIVGFTALNPEVDPTATSEWVLALGPHNQAPWTSKGLTAYASDSW